MFDFPAIPTIPIEPAGPGGPFGPFCPIPAITLSPILPGRSSWTDCAALFLFRPKFNIISINSWFARHSWFPWRVVFSCWAWKTYRAGWACQRLTSCLK
uniref:Candidate secreted effector n=1 Tax=Meloidogyne incognita TaxID=6306 RepID=A0A914MM90_MELIC